MESESSDAEESFLCRLECPVCMEYMRPPITLCENGHKVCSKCRPRIQICPSCRGNFSDTRSLALEDRARQVKYPCKFRTYGCTEICSHDMIGGHQVKCLYFQQQCPAAKLAVRTCSWTGSFKDIKEHLKENHLEQCCEYVEGDFKFLYNVIWNTRLICFIFAYNEIFFSVFETREPEFYAAVLYVGPAENAAKYKYRVEFVNKDNTEGITVMHLTRSSDENLDNIYSSGTCGIFRYDSLRRLEDEEGKVKFNLEIIKLCK